MRDHLSQEPHIQRLPGERHHRRHVGVHVWISGRLLAPTFCHDETRTSRMMSRLVALTGFPARRRFTSRILREALEREGLRIERQETVPGPIPISHVDGVFAAAERK